MNTQKTHDAFVNELSSVNPMIEVLGTYSGARFPIKVRCTACGNTWDSLPTNLLKGRRCPKCSYVSRGLKRRKSKDETIAKIKKINPDIDVIGEYKKTSTKVLAKCKICGYEWKVLPSSLQCGSGCPKCARVGTSFVEQTILLSLEKLTGFEAVSRNRTLIGLELDIYIPELKFAVEYGAWPWHEGKEARDEEKIKRCTEKHIKLIEIFDAYPDETYIGKNKWYFKENISRISNSNIVREIVIRLCNEIGIRYSLSDSDFAEIQRQARLNSRTMTTSELNTKLHENGINIEVLSEYQDMLTKVRAKCLICENEWNVIPASLLRGLGCPQCANKSRGDKRRKSKEQFIFELSKANPNVEVLGEYKNTNTHIEVRCRRHNVIWNTLPYTLLRGGGCPQCRIEKIRYSLRKSERQFISDLFQVNPNIEVIGNYENNRAKIEVSCKICSDRWMAIPSTLLKGEGCPKCGRIAQANARRKTNSQFIHELGRINPCVEVKEDYQGNKSPILVQCKICMREWKAVPTSLLRGSGCPFCAGNKRKTHESFVEEIGKKNPDIIILGYYQNAKTKILIRCRKCNYEWEVSPTNLLSGRGCPNCRKRQ